MPRAKKTPSESPPIVAESPVIPAAQPSAQPAPSGAPTPAPDWADDPVSSVLEALRGTDHAIIEVYRMRPSDGREERIGGFAPDALDLDNIQRTRGGGTYRLRGRVNGKYVGANRTITLADPLPEDEAPAPPLPAAAPPAMDPFAAINQLRAEFREMMDQIRRPAGGLGLGEVMPLLQAVIARPPELSLKDILPLLAKPAGSNVVELVEAMKSLRDLAGDPAPAASDGLGQLAAAFGPMLAQQLAPAAPTPMAPAPPPAPMAPRPQLAGVAAPHSSPAPGQAAPAPAAGLGQGGAPPPPASPPDFKSAIEPLVPALVIGARTNGPVGTYAEMLCDALDDAGVVELATAQLAAIEPEALAALCVELFPKLAGHGAWLTGVADELMAYLAGQAEQRAAALAAGGVDPHAAAASGGAA